MPRPRRPPVDVLHEKARKLAATGRVENLGNGAYNIIGDHGTYTVVQDYQGKFSCNCPGYLQKQRCSHVEAVALLSHRRPRR